MDNLTLEDCEILIEALSAWETQESRNAMLGNIMGMTFAGIGKETQEEREKALADATTKAKQEQDNIQLQEKSKREQSILLKAKLIHIRDIAGVDSLTN